MFKVDLCNFLKVYKISAVLRKCGSNSNIFILYSRYFISLYTILIYHRLIILWFSSTDANTSIKWLQDSIDKSGENAISDHICLHNCN